jgi:fatty-acyl-CoA synthase
VPDDYGVGSWPHRRARINPAGLALRQARRTLTYGELARRVEQLARSLAARGIRPGDRVAYLGLNDIATFEVFFAAGRLGAIFVPLNTRLAAGEITALLDDAAPGALFYGPEQEELIWQVGPAARGAGVLAPVRGTGGSGGDSYEALIEAGASLPPVAAEVALSDHAVILYTSGTTGRPKGALLSHANLTFNTMNQLAHVDVLSTDTALCMCPLFHATGLGQVSLPTIFKGGTVVMSPKFEPGEILAAIAQLRIASFSAVPTMLQMLCDHPDFPGTELSSVRYVIYGGSMVTERVAVAWQDRGVHVLQGYGMTEAAPGVYLAIPDGAAQRPVSVGLPHFFTDVALSPLSGQEPGASSGELLVRGLNVSGGYWNRPAETAQAFPDGWFRSGDVIRTAGDGWAYVVDRIKDIIISGGENIYPAQVEAVISSLPGVADCALIAVPDQRWGEVGLAFVVQAAPQAWTEASLREALRTELAAFKIPKYVRFVDQLPRTATGKVRKQDLRSLAAAEGDHDAHDR